MFGLSMKEVLFKTVSNACYNCKNTYKFSLLDRLEELNSADEETAEKINTEISRAYFNAVKNTVVDSFRLSSPAIYARIQLALRSPSMCGYDIDVDTEMMAGSVFAICYFAIKNRVAPAKLCIKLNHIQGDVMQKVLYEIADEM